MIRTRALVPGTSSTALRPYQPGLSPFPAVAGAGGDAPEDGSSSETFASGENPLGPIARSGRSDQRRPPADLALYPRMAADLR